MELGLTDKVVVVTGASRGIGFACAAAFLEEGAKVVLVSRDPLRLEHAAARLHSAGDYPPAIVCADLTRPEDAKRMADEVAEHFGAVDILVNSAGAAKRYLPDELDASAWHAAMQAKYFTYIHMLDPVVKRMAARGLGAIVNVIGAGGKVASPTHLSGGAANAALMLVTAGLAATYGASGVRVNAVNPGLTLTERLKEGIAADAKLNAISPEEALKRANERLPLRHIATPEEIANAVVFLASPKAGYISGAIVAMDGAVTPMVV